MKLLVAVIFFCKGGGCYFWVSDQTFYDVDKCQEVLIKASKELDVQGVPNQGTCIPINTKNNI